MLTPATKAQLELTRKIAARMTEPSVDAIGVVIRLRTAVQKFATEVAG